MATIQPKVHCVHRRCTPDTFPCPTCGVPGRRKGTRTFTRTVRCIAYQEIRQVKLTTAEYRAHCACCSTFRSQIADILPRADYTNRVREAVLDRLLEDNMTVEQLRRALARDFFLELSDGFVYDCLDWKVRQTNGEAYRQWTLQEFSGTLCIDEIHLGQKVLLLATDPIADFPVAFALVSSNDQDHMRRFLNNLRTWGFLPQVVITDGSNLYPTLIAELWRHARHQLCVFHVLQDINKEVLDAVKRLRRQLARRGNSGRKRRRGRPRQGAKKRRGLTLKDKAHFVFKKRYLIVHRRDTLSEQEQQDLHTMLEYLPGLRVLRQFVDRVHRLFAAEQSKHQAWCRRAALLRTTAFQDIPELAKVLKSLTEENFGKMVAFLHSPMGQRLRTNNHVERTNRRLRYLEKVRYKWRRRRTIVRFIVLTFARWHQQRLLTRKSAEAPMTPDQPTKASGQPIKAKGRPGKRTATAA